MTDALQQFNDQKYLTIETFRKNGQGVKTPVWFAREGDSLLIWTESGSGKAKRIRNNGRVNVAPSTAAGQVSGEWVNAQATRDDSEQAVAHTAQLFRKKYGFAFSMFGLLGKMRKAKYTSIKLQFPA